MTAPSRTHLEKARQFVRDYRVRDMFGVGAAPTLELAEMLAAEHDAALESGAAQLEAQAFAYECADDTMAGVREGSPYRKGAAMLRAMKNGASDE